MYTLKIGSRLQLIAPQCILRKAPLCKDALRLDNSIACKLDTKHSNLTFGQPVGGTGPHRLPRKLRSIHHPCFQVLILMLLCLVPPP